MTRPLSALVVALLLLAGCGTDTAPVSSSSDADAVLSATFANLAKIDSATVDLNAQATQAGSGPVSASVKGPFVSQGAGKLPKFSITSTTTKGGKTMTVGATYTGSKGFASLQGTDYEVAGPAMRQLEAAYEQAAKAGQGAVTGVLLGVDFTKWLPNARNEGTEQLGGVETVKIAGDADVARVAADLSKIGAGLQTLGIPGAGGPLPDSKQLADSVKSLTVTVNTGADDQILRRLVVKGALKDGSTLLLDLQLNKVGEDQTITEPAHPKPFSELMKALGGSGLGLAIK